MINQLKTVEKRKKNSGFTFIELLSVIALIGILIILAIPTISKIIHNSRIKSVISSIDSYVTTIAGETNSLTYDFTENNTIIAIPIECIELEQGGDKARGEWLQANDDYWAYVLVQYDSERLKYKYAFTFKDSLGYSMYPTKIDLVQKNDNLIKTNLDVTKPTTGVYTEYTSAENWKDSGFKLNETTQLRVLEAESEGQEGDGKNTCTLCQKGTNYEEVEKIKKIPKVSLTLSPSDDSKIKIRGVFENYNGGVNDCYPITAHGIIYIRQSRIGTRILTINTAGKTRVNFSEFAEDGSYTYNLTVNDKSTVYAFRAFIIYKDSEGKSKTVYSAMRRSSYNILSK